jgi:hypothetical protein
MQRRELLKNTAILLGGLASASVAQAVMAGVDGRVKIARPMFSYDQKKMTEQLAEMIIPRTDTPGAIDAGVPHFIELMVSDWYTKTERGIYFAGLLSLDVFCQENFAQDFMACGEGQRIEALEQAEREAENYKPAKSENVIQPEEDENKPFFTQIKELTVLGYYTSSEGAQKELRYDPMPMRYEDMDLSEAGRQWSS